MIPKRQWPYAGIAYWPALIVIISSGTVSAEPRAPVSPRGELAILPGPLTLHGRGVSHGVRVVELIDGHVRVDHTVVAELRSSSEQVFTVDSPMGNARAGNAESIGIVRSVGDGQATLTAVVGGRSVSVEVTVRGTAEVGRVSFRNEVTPVLTRNACNSGACHGALAGKGGLKLSLRGYDLKTDHFVLTRQAAGRRIDTDRPAESLLLTKPTGAIRHGGGMKLTADTADYNVIRDWIAQGAAPATDSDPTVTDLRVFPSSATLRIGDTLRLLVQAVYSDGWVRDVTGWAKFSVADELVAAVDEHGRVRVNGVGEAPVTIVFDGRPVMATITVPTVTKLDPSTFTRSARHNFIDEHILTKLMALGLPPSPPCSDSEFIRRAFLDALGVLPTLEETTAFLADTTPDKRTRLVDQLLSRPEFVDYWTHKWGDLLLVSSKKLATPAMWAYHDWIRRAVADNKPWDRFAREVLTAEGSTLENGAGNFFVLHKDIAELTEAVSVTFMGMGLTCARCHNHPLEKWTQDQYYGLANLLSRVRHKAGKRTGETLLAESPDGDVLHPRTGRPIPPQPLDGPTLPLDSRANRRAFLADWLTRPENPFFARNAVNRIWRNFMGRGLVETEDDHRASNPATNEPLLSALSAEFVRSGYDTRHMIRLVMLSAAYQRSSQPAPGAPTNPADDRFYSRYIPRRLSAEVLLDAYSQVSGVPTSFTQMDRDGRPSGYKFPAGVRAVQLPDTRIASQFLTAFGQPERAQACSCERSEDNTLAQALHLANGNTINEKLRAKGGRIDAWLAEKISDAEAIRRTYLLCLSREPTPTEAERFTQILAAAEAPADPKSAAELRRALLEDLVWSVATGKDFLFNH